ncbi:hypothetical protein QCA50_016928 [Cerrena zonata]|uniref:Histone chaperone RTT106/FACT complex subunit SPT16-like middle domain-containing protein n=1 Tax=Cerrena zonata TaxID=2478898 RepID=A0AAW0FKX7_9APHY
MNSAYLQLVQDSISKEYSDQLKSLPNATCGLLDTVLRFALGAECPSDASPDIKTQWKDQQRTFEQLRRKRPREDEQVTDAKRVRTDEPALFTLRNFSVTSPVRKRVHISIHKSYIQLTHPASDAVESTIPLSSVTQAFLLPTRGKSKPHWTTILLTPENQVVFGIDATPPPFETTDQTGTTTKHPKNTPVLDHLHTFLSHLPIPTLEPSLTVFKSALGQTSGTEGYRGAKAGTLWFLTDGVLWDASKTCEFWDMRDIAPDGVRTISATGRSCSVILTRKESEQPIDIQMVDGKEQDPITRWVRANQHRFGKSDDPGVAAAQDDSDEEDEDYTFDSSDDDGGSATSDSSDSDDEGGGGSGDEEAEAEVSGDEGEDDEVEELDPARHPLLRPGAMPKMSKAAMEAAVGIVEDAFMGAPVDGEDEEDGEEEDQLDD